MINGLKILQDARTKMLKDKYGAEWSYWFMFMGDVIDSYILGSSRLKLLNKRFKLLNK
jgi:hypothetical protein